MASIELSSPAKVNLRLEVFDKRPDSYHNVRTILHCIELTDEIKISPLSHKKGIHVIFDNFELPNGSKNLVYMAASSILQKVEKKIGLEIRIRKRIPVSAGLGGGSSNAATTLLGINSLLGLNLSDPELMDIGSLLGADVPFFVYKDTAIATGIGNLFQRMIISPQIYFILINPSFQISSRWAYSHLKQGLTIRRNAINISTVISQFSDIIPLLCNDLEVVAIKRYPEIGEIKDMLIRYGAKGSLMSGSGPTVFGIFPEKEEAESTLNRLSINPRWKVFLTRSL